MSISETEDAIFTKRRLSLWGCGFLAANAVAFALRFLAGKWLFKAGHPAFLDFLNWWVASQFALARNAAGVYDFSAFSAAQASVAKSIPPITYFRWDYPPTMLLLVMPLARLPYTAAFFAWSAATFCLYAASLYAILPELTTIALALLPVPVIMNVFLGQTAFLMTGLLGLSLVFMSRRPYLAGVCLGLLTYKPQFILFFPLALIVTGQWRVIAGAIASASAFAVAASLTFGFGAWQSFLHSIRGSNPANFLTVHVEGIHQTAFGLMRWAGSGLTAAWVVQLVVALLATALACQIWQRPVPHSLKGAAFSIGALIVTPYMLLYDLTALSIPVAFLVEDGLARGFLPGERSILGGCFLALFLCFNFAVGPIVLIVLMGLVVRRLDIPWAPDWRREPPFTAEVGRQSSDAHGSV